MNRTIVIAVAAIFMAACGSNRPTAEQTTEQITGQTVEMQATPGVAENDKRNMCGGYSQARLLDDNEKALFAKVTGNIKGVSYTADSVSTQVVAGTNYRFICTGRMATSPEQSIRVNIIIFQPLPNQGEPHITSITKADE